MIAPLIFLALAWLTLGGIFNLALLFLATRGDGEAVFGRGDAWMMLLSFIFWPYVLAVLVAVMTNGEDKPGDKGAPE